MDCLHPILLKNPDFGQPYDLYGTPSFSVPCGHCPACIVNNANEWRTRLEIELSQSDSAYFITLTYDDAKLPYVSISDCAGHSSLVPCVCKRDIQLFLKRLRKNFQPIKLRYFIVSEYGPTTYRPHYHGIIFGLPRLHNDDLVNKSKITKIIGDVWNNGFVTLDSVTFSRIAYVTKYMACVTHLPDYLPKPFRLMSRNPGIGYSYVTNSKIVEWHRQNLACYYPDGNFKRRLPRYIKDKIFDDYQKYLIREQIKIQKHESESLETRARNCGYGNRYDYIFDRNKSFQRKFERQLVKKRKDI